MIISQMIVLKLLAGASEVETIEPLRGGDSSKRALRLLMPDERLDRQLRREDDEVLAIVIAITESADK
jgi:hypothetical protein